ncbi:MAG TPA: AAA family ATPase [Chloroflexaceae bacterium]|nr:AAA family ATPase [Chloroflexaceae bacterium]
MTNAEPRVRTLVVTAPERIDQEWIGRLGASSEIELLERVALVSQAGELARRLRPDLVIIDRELGQAEICVRQVLAAAPDTFCVVVTPDPDLAALRRLMAAGTRDVLSTPVALGDLLAAARQARAAAAERRQAGQAGAQGAQRGKLIVVTAPKGGVGTTMVASNLAVALREVSGSGVALVDCSLQFGDIGVHLNLRSKYSLLDLTGVAHEIDDAMLARVVCKHDSGVDVLLAPPEPDAAASVDGASVGAVLDKLRERYSFVVVDTWTFLDEVTETLLRRADEVLLVTTPELPTLRNAKRLLEFTQRQEMVTGHVMIVLNRFPSVEGISLDDVQQHLHHPVAANIPSEGMPVTHSINRGVPLVISHPKSWAAQNILRIATRLAGDDVSTIALTAEDARRGATRKGDARPGLFKFARRGA